MRARVATLNVLGWHHTEPGGKNDGLGDGVTRMRRMLAAIRMARVSVVTLQELETPMAAVIEGRTGWELFRSKPNQVLAGKNAMGNGIMWRTRTWRLVKSTSVKADIKGRTLWFPLVVLEHRRSGRQVTVLGFHNPGVGPISGGSDEDRVLCKLAQRIAVEPELTRKSPVIVAGDANSEGYGLKSMARVAGQGVDHILIANLTHSRPRVHWFRRLGWTDHNMVSVRVHSLRG